MIKGRSEQCRWKLISAAFVCWLLLLSCSAIGQEPQRAETTTVTAGGVSFSVATVKPADPRLSGWKMEFTNTGFEGRGVTLKMLIQEGWNLYGQGQLAGGPPWVNKAKFDVDAKVDPDDMSRFDKMNLQARRMSLQALLSKRFGVSLQNERRQVVVFELRSIGQGRSISQNKTPHSSSTPGQDSLVVASKSGYIQGENFSMSQLAVLLQSLTDRIVRDKTGLAAKYDFSLTWTPDGDSTNNDGGEGPSLVTAVKEDLGLKLEPVKILTEVMVIKSAVLPDAN